MVDWKWLPVVGVLGLWAGFALGLVWAGMRT